MFKIRTMNAISENGVAYLEKRGCEVGPAVEAPDAMLIRSADLHGMQFNPELLAIGRAGAGYNNIPVVQLAEEGIVVFNSPGANAEAVKEQEMSPSLWRPGMSSVLSIMSVPLRIRERTFLCLWKRGKAPLPARS